MIDKIIFLLDKLPISWLLKLFKKMQKAKLLFFSIWIMMSTVSFFMVIKLQYQFDDLRRNSPYRISSDIRQVDENLKNMLKKCGYDSYSYWFVIGNPDIKIDNDKESFLSLIKREKYIYAVSALGCEKDRGEECIFDNWGNNKKFNNEKGKPLSNAMQYFIELNSLNIGYKNFSFKEGDVVFFKLRDSLGNLTELAENLKSTYNEVWSLIDDDNGIKVHDIYFIKYRDKIYNDVIYIITLSFGKNATIKCSSSYRTESPETLLKNIL